MNMTMAFNSLSVLNTAPLTGISTKVSARAWMKYLCIPVSRSISITPYWYIAPDTLTI